MKTNYKKHQLALALLILPLCLAFQNCSKAISFSRNPSTAVTDETVTTASIPLKEYINKTQSFSTTATSNKVDVLVVIDNSGSMVFEQQNMANRFSSFLDQLKQLDWQVGIITTDVSNSVLPTTDGQLLSYNGSNKYLIKSSEPLVDSKNLFSTAIKRNEWGSGAEQGLKASLRALERAAIPGSNNSQLIRSGAALSIIVVTDANETGPTRAEELLEYIKSNHSDKNFKFHSIIVKDNDENCLKDETQFINASNKSEKNLNEDYGSEYQKLSELSSGLLGSVCSSNYGSQLQAIGQSTADQVKEISLDCLPVDKDGNGLVDLEIKNTSTNTLISNYVLNGLQVKFDQVLAAGSYSATYTCEK